jgi:hypothetical protein
MTGGIESYFPDTSAASLFVGGRLDFLILAILEPGDIFADKA